MDAHVRSKLILVPVKIIALLIALMILVRLGYVFYDFLLNPFHEPATLSEESVKHVMTALILLELFALTLRFLVQDLIDPILILITVLTALGRDLIVLNFKETHYLSLLALGFIFAVTIAGIYFLRKNPG
ncbi:MAG: phosphate-starvation-inducible PsiE family protein [Nitrospirota bacterium]